MTSFMFARLFYPLFATLLAIRFAYPFFNEPLQHMSGLAGRQWKQAGSLFDPLIMSAVDSFLYQPYLAFVRWLTLDISWALNCMTGLLCASMPVCWYLCAKELLPRGWAMASALIIAVVPSFFTIYAFFASETILLPLMGLACWQTAKCYKTGNLWSFFFACLFWTLAAYTRHIALPPALVCFIILAWRCRWPAEAMVASLLLFCSIGGISAWHSHKAINVYTPFGLPALNTLLANSHGYKVIYYFDGDRRWFRSPSLYYRPLEPFSDFRVENLQEPLKVNIDTSKGIEDWDKALDTVPLSVDSYMARVAYNVVYLFFGASWPDAWPDTWASESDYIPIESDINYWSRWMWAPIILFVFIGAARYRGPVINHAFMVLTLGMLVILMLQFSGVLEGRYRKPMEPMLVLSALMILHARKEAKHG